MKWNDVFDHGLEVKAVDESVKYFYKHYAVRKDLKILDAGCGTGRHTLFFASKKLNVYAVDNSTSALSILKKKLRSKSYSKFVTLKRSNIAKLPYSNNFFDIIICTRVLHHGYERQIRTWFREINRVLKCGGFFIPSILSAHDKRARTGKKIEVSTRLNIKDTFDPEIPHHFFSKSEIKKLLKNFNILRMKEVVAPVGRGYGKMLYYEIIAKKQ